MTPAIAPSPAPITNVSAITVLMSMPISPATCWFCDVARIAMPSFVRYTSASSPPIISTDVTMITTCTLVIVAPFGLSVMWMGVTRDDLRERDRIAAPDDHRDVLQDDGQADGRDERRQSRRLAQRPVGDALERVADSHADGDRHQNAGDQDRKRRQSDAAPRRAP